MTSELEREIECLTYENELLIECRVDLEAKLASLRSALNKAADEIDRLKAIIMASENTKMWAEASMISE